MRHGFDNRLWPTPQACFPDAGEALVGVDQDHSQRSPRSLRGDAFDIGDFHRRLRMKVGRLWHEFEGKESGVAEAEG